MTTITEPTPIFRLLQSARSDASPPVLQQWWVTGFDLAFSQVEMCQHGYAGAEEWEGEWRDVPIVTEVP